MISGSRSFFLKTHCSIESKVRQVKKSRSGELDILRRLPPDSHTKTASPQEHQGKTLAGVHISYLYRIQRNLTGINTVSPVRGYQYTRFNVLYDLLSNNDRSGCQTDQYDAPDRDE